MAGVVPEKEFRQAIKWWLWPFYDQVKSVTGPGRSGAVAAVYASHLLGVPFIPFGQPCPEKLQPLLIVDTAAKTGKTLRKAASKYTGADVHTLYIYDEPPIVKFWYEVHK